MEQAAHEENETSRLAENRICLHIWRSRRLVHSSTRGKSVHACDECLREWSRLVRIPRSR